MFQDKHSNLYIMINFGIVDVDVIIMFVLKHLLYSDDVSRLKDVKR